MPGMSGMVIAHDNDSSAHLLGMTKHYWETWGHRELFTTKHEATNKLAWKENRSLLTISTAKNAKAGRSRTLQFVHCSEAAFYDDPRVLTISLHQHPVTLWPGTGFVTELGGRGAQGMAVNVPLPPHTRDPAWQRAFHAVVPSLLGAFKPQVLVTQCGVDTHEEDPLADLSLLR